MTPQPQPCLFDLPSTRTAGKPLSHRADPVTSYIAAEKLAKSGKWVSQKQEVYEALKAAMQRYKKGATSAEVSAFMKTCDPMNRFVAARRLPELARLPDSPVRKGPIRQCSTTGSLCVTWWLTEPKEQP